MDKAKAMEAAKKYNVRVAALKDRELYLSRFGRELRAEAAAAIENPIVGTAAEIAERFGKYLHLSGRVADHDADEVFVWAFNEESSLYSWTDRKNISIFPIGI